MPFYITPNGEKANNTNTLPQGQELYYHLLEQCYIASNENIKLMWEMFHSWDLKDIIETYIVVKCINVNKV